MKSISKIASGIQPSATLAINALSKEMKEQGIDVVGFGAGEPDFVTPEHIKKAAITAILENNSYYTASSGLQALKEAITAYMSKEFGLQYGSNQICVSSGAKHILFITLQTILDPGDEVILPAPYWVTYAEAIRMCGAVPVVVETFEEENFKMSAKMLEAAITEKTKCLILTNPSNPTGMLYSREELEALSEVILKHDIFVIDDQIYAKLVYKGEYVALASLNDDIKRNTIVVNGVSKTYAMTGWRVGFAAADPVIISSMAKYLDHSTGNVSNPAQYAAIAAYLGDQQCADDMRAEFDRRRTYFVKRVGEIEGVSCLEPDGAFYIFMNVKKTFGHRICGETINSSSDFCNALLKHGLVATVPGEAFGMNGYVRWSYATSMENIKKGLDRLEIFLKNWQ